MWLDELVLLARFMGWLAFSLEAGNGWKERGRACFASPPEPSLASECGWSPRGLVNPQDQFEHKSGGAALTTITSTMPVPTDDPQPLPYPGPVSYASQESLQLLRRLSRLPAGREPPAPQRGPLQKT